MLSVRADHIFSSVFFTKVKMQFSRSILPLKVSNVIMSSLGTVTVVPINILYIILQPL